MKNIIEIEAPAQWVTALINHDFSGLDPEDADKVRQWIKFQGLGSPSSVKEPFTARFEGQITEMATYAFLTD